MVRSPKLNICIQSLNVKTGSSMNYKMRHQQEGRKPRKTYNICHRRPLSLSSYHFFVLLALSWASTNTASPVSRRTAEKEGTHVRVLVPSSPSRNACAVSPVEPPPPPAGPSAAKCCAWSITSTSRSRNVYRSNSSQFVTVSSSTYLC